MPCHNGLFHDELYPVPRLCETILVQFSEGVVSGHQGGVAGLLTEYGCLVDGTFLALGEDLGCDGGLVVYFLGCEVVVCQSFRGGDSLVGIDLQHSLQEIQSCIATLLPF